MMVSIENHSFKYSNPFSIISNVQQIYKQINMILKRFNGNIVQQNVDGCLISFRTVTDAVSCALKIYENYR